MTAPHHPSPLASRSSTPYLGAAGQIKHADVPYSRPASPGHAGVTPQIGWLGLGSMGYLMARNLANNSHAHPPGAPALLVYNRSVAKSEKLMEEVGGNKIRIAESPAQLVLECDIIITNLANDDVVRQIYIEMTAALQRKHTPTKGKIFVETSTIYPTLAGELDILVSKIPHAHLITSPVFGAPAAADKAQLVIVMSGDYRSKKQVAYLLCPGVGRKVIDLGGNLEKAPTFKLMGNSMILGCLEVMAESLTLAEKSGIGEDAAAQFIKEMLPAGPLIGYSEKMVHDQFDGTKGFAIDGGIKDATHIRKLTTEHNCPMPVIDAAHAHLLTARALNINLQRKGTSRFDTLDWSALIAGTRVAAGLDGFDSSKHQAKVVKED